LQVLDFGTATVCSESFYGLVENSGKRFEVGADGAKRVIGTNTVWLLGPRSSERASFTPPAKCRDF